jgi:hypothetical protein
MGRASAHADRVRPWIEPRLQRRREGRSHPVDDFLFTYYPFSPGRLARWEPGAGFALEAPVPHLAGLPGYVEQDGVMELRPQALRRQCTALEPVRALLRATAGRAPRIGCGARHEWAMVYRIPPEEVRHTGYRLRLPPATIDAVVEKQGLTCTHFDAFRFFTPLAAPRNTQQLRRADQPALEQPGCLHATMDLYKWTSTLRPLVAAELVADTFDLARSARELDMRAAPYDLSELGVVPLRLEEASGRAEFAVLQRVLAAQGQQLRALVLEALDGVAALLGEAGG